MKKKENLMDSPGADVLDNVIQVAPEAGPVDLNVRVKVKHNETSPYHKDGEVADCSPVLAKKFVANEWGKIVTALLVMFMLSFGIAQAQGTAYQKLGKSVSHLPTDTNYLIYSDTVTNTATNYLTTGYPQFTVSTGSSTAFAYTAIVNPALSTTIQVDITKISGTVAGTVTLQGSLDGVNFSTVSSPLYGLTATATATNVTSQSFSFTVGNNPYRFYRISWTGAGTMSASMAAKVWSH